MPNNKPLEQWQKEDAERLKSLWLEHQRTFKPKLPQTKAAAEIGMTQGAFSQYINGKIPLNLDALFNFVHLLGCRLSQISPTLSEKVYRWIDEAERKSLIAIEEYLSTDDLQSLTTTELRAIEAMVKHLLSGKKGTPTPGREGFRPRLVLSEKSKGRA